MLDPAGLWVDLLVLHLMDAHRQASVVKDHASGTGRTLVYCCNVIRHFVFSFVISVQWVSDSVVQ
jgi:hypothetical protein